MEVSYDAKLLPDNYGFRKERNTVSQLTVLFILLFTIYTPPPGSQMRLHPLLLLRLLPDYLTSRKEAPPDQQVALSMMLCHKNSETRPVRH